MRDFDEDISSVQLVDREVFKDFLDADESVVSVIKPNKKRHYKWLLFFAIPIFWPHFIMLTVLTLGIFPFLYAKKGYDNLYYAYTNKRVIVRSGSFGVTYRGIEYKEIVTTDATTNFLDKKYNTGTIQFRAQRQSVCFSNIDNPFDTLREIRDYIEHNVK